MTIEGHVSSEESSSTASLVRFTWKEGEHLGEARSIESKEVMMLSSCAFAGCPQGQPGLALAGVAAGGSLRPWPRRCSCPAESQCRSAPESCPSKAVGRES